MDVCVYSVFVLDSGLATVLGLRNLSETKRFTDALCPKWEQQEKEILQGMEFNTIYIFVQTCSKSHLNK
jgi:hypothetical protein